MGRARHSLRAWLNVLRGAEFQQKAPPTAGNPVEEPVALQEHAYHGLDNLDQKIEKYLDFEGGFYVELGANDGVRFSNTYYYETQRDWRGVLIEPAPNRFLECRANRGARNFVACAACVSFDYEHEFVKMYYSDLMSVTTDLETDVISATAHAELGRQFLSREADVFLFGAQARTLNAILIEAKAPRLVDFLSLDVEGAEIEVLKGVDHSQFRFKYMLIESRNIEKLEAYLMPLNYRLAEKFDEHDYMFVAD